ncbi:cAMP-binding domain of CRP or a regulatory subunit of cAMP-dependent protein kinases [Ruminococcus flavefaciens]|uniref:cAMP-binding domain of CRP or a regulatory subunit of cAMP-dependent protein kinases n=1 Tax=Ruminococcus flavefaciens TaxID=1265 RepID=A0A1H6HR90_RUMFL|nr:Crp/Fnr family transcriptional regulator [Ruminococcus flavefaciens]SEH36694.1 cAMP-binding domain of CRP or a regulatory subunit of cAMP-dependent protein kinases [Ruminococcus flavefaciens]
MLPENNILFKGIEREDCHRMIDCFNAEIKKFKPGGRIMDYSDNPDKLGIVLNGTAVMVRYDINGVRSIMESLEEQNIFGVYFTFTASQRSSIEIIAETECEVMFVRRSEITKRCENACQCHSRVVENLLELMSEKAISLNERIEVLSQRTIEDKLISCLSIIEEKTPKGKTPQIPFSTTALSDYLCVNRSALQREITRLKRTGVLTISKRKFKLIRNLDSDN